MLTSILTNTEGIRKNLIRIQQELELILSSKSNNTTSDEELNAILSSIEAIYKSSIPKLDSIAALEKIAIDNELLNACKLLNEFLSKNATYYSSDYLKHLEQLSQYLERESIFDLRLQSLVLEEDEDSEKPLTNITIFLNFYADYINKYGEHFFSNEKVQHINIIHRLTNDAEVAFEDIEAINEGVAALKDYKAAIERVSLSIHAIVEQDSSLKLLIQHQDDLNQAIEDTKQMIKMGFSLSEPLVVTPLGWLANKYPEIADYCNQISMELDEEVISEVEIEDQTLIGEF